jgi:lipopolysaccharide transport system permease protein
MTATTHTAEIDAHNLTASPRAVIQPSKGWVALRLREFWEFRELLYFLVWREVKVRYKQTAIGAAWAIIQPLFTMLIFSLFFGKLAKVPSDGVPYPVFSLSGAVIWTFFANGLSQSAGSLVENSNLISKIYFPRLIVPVASVLSGLVDFAIGLTLLLIFIAANGIHPTMHMLWLPAFLLLAVASALGAGLWLSALNVEYRDVRYVVPFLVQLWMFATPVAYPSSLLHEPWRTVYALNPLAGVVEGFRWALLGTSHAPGAMVIVSSLMALFAVISGAFYFRRMEKTFADLI